MQLSTVNVMKTVVSSEMVIADEATIRKVQDVLLVILDDIVSYCDAEDIDYVLSGGSCLGAVRHQGFIPWDEDMDIDMPRESYDRFVTGFAERFADKYFVQSPEHTPEVGIGTARVRLRGTTMRMHDDCGLRYEDSGIFIDIFPIENVPDNAVLRRLHGTLCMATGLLYSCRRFWRDRKFYLRFSADDKSFRRSVIIKAILGAPLSILSMASWSKIPADVYALCKNGSSVMVNVPFGRGHYYGELLPRASFAMSQNAVFEGRCVRIPKDAEGYLKRQYGDWQRIPAPEEREHHAYLALDLGRYDSDKA